MRGTKKRSLTVPVFLAYCVLGAALRSLVRRRGSVRALLVVETSDAAEIFAEAGRLFLRQHFHFEEYENPTVWALSESRRGNRVRRSVFEEASEKSQAILVCDTETEFDEEEAALWADLFVHLPKPTARQFKAAFRRFGHVLKDADLEMVSTETWARLSYAFPPKRSVTVGLQRLRAAIHLSAKTTNALDDGPTLENLCGFGKAAEWGLELAQDLADYAAGRIDWSDVDTGVLISGPPGTGKTLFAEALARTCKVPLVVGSAARWQAHGHLGDFLKAMSDTFKEARSKAPSILFLDEIDAFGDRTGDAHNGDYKRQAINGFLECLDGIDRRVGIVVVAATNHPGVLDPAVRRAGRLDRHIVIEKPDGQSRLKIAEQYAGISIPIEYLERFSRTTRGMTGADISKLVREAKRLARRRCEAVTAEDIIACLPKLQPLPPDLLRVTAVHEAGHAVVGIILDLGTLEAVFMRDDIVVGAAESIGRALFADDRAAGRTRTHYLAQVCTLLAGIAAEELEFGEACDVAAGGDNSDLSKATSLATLLEASFGLGSTLIVESASDKNLSALRTQNREIRAAVDAVLTEQYSRARRILDENRAALREIADEVLKVRHLQGGAVLEIVQRHRTGADNPLQGRVNKAKVDAALAVLDRVPDVAPDPGDDLVP
jgi:ATP-dependent metalloprotease